MDTEKIDKRAKSILSTLGKNYGCVAIIEEDITHVIPVYREPNLQFAFAENGVNEKDVSMS